MDSDTVEDAADAVSDAADRLFGDDEDAEADTGDE
jgi:hypothetical protein